VELGIAAAEIETVHVRRLAVGQRAPRDQRCARRAQQVEVLGVIELECRITRDPDRRARRDTKRRRGVERARRGEREQAVELETTLDGVGHTVETRVVEHASAR